MIPPEAFPNPVESGVFTATQLLDVGVAIILAAIALTAFRTTGIKKIVFAIVAFTLVAVQHVINYIDSSVTDFMPDDIRYILFSAITLAIMLMFFLAIVRK